MKKILFFKRQNCSNCHKVTELLKTISIDGLSIEEINADENKDLIEKYAPKNQNWQLPLLVFTDGDVVLNVTTGLVDEELIRMPYLNTVELESLAFRALKSLEITKISVKLLEQRNKYIATILDGKQNLIEVNNVNSVLPVDLPIDPADETGCDGCQ